MNHQRKTLKLVNTYSMTNRTINETGPFFFFLFFSLSFELLN